LNRFDSSLLKRYPAELEGFDEDTFRADESEGTRELFGFIDEVEVHWRNNSLTLM